MKRNRCWALLILVGGTSIASAQDTPRNSLEEARGTGRGVRLGEGTRYVPATHLVRQGDTLWDITGHYYGNPWQWPRVWSYNPEITNPHWIYPSAEVRLLPAGESAVTDRGLSVVAMHTRTAGDVFLRNEGFLDEQALRRAGVISGAFEEHMLLSPYDQIYLTFDREPTFEAGHELTIFRPVDADDRVAGEEGTLVRVYGTVRYESYDRERRMARATITEALDPIERGFRVADVPRHFAEVPPVTNDRDLTTQVIAVVRPRTLIGDQMVVFVDAGRDQGLQLGNRLFIVRRQDEWRQNLPGTLASVGSTETVLPESADYPEEIIAELRVVDVRAKTSALFVTRALSEIFLRDRVEMRRGY